MAHLHYSNYPGYGDFAKEEYHYSQALRIGDIIELSGQGTHLFPTFITRLLSQISSLATDSDVLIEGGWNRQTHDIPQDLASEIRQAFENVDVAVKTAGGAGWSDVYKIRTYHTPPLDDKLLQIMVAELKKWCPDHQPLWTCIGVAKLALDAMNVEIEVKAHTKS